MIYLFIYLLGVIATAIMIYLYEKKWIDEGLDYKLSNLIFDIVVLSTSWCGLIGGLFAIIDIDIDIDDIVLFKGKRK